MGEDHSCCKDTNKSKKSDKKKSKKDNCFHTIASQSDSKQILHNMKIEKSPNSLVFTLADSLLTKPELYHDIQPKIPDNLNLYLRYKSRLRLHILKDQFLI